MTTPAEQFLRKFMDASARAEALAAMGEDPDGFSHAVANEPEAFGLALEEDAARAPAGPALINTSVFASAACDGDGFVVAADDRFRAWLASSNVVHVDLAPLAKGGASVSFLVEDRGKFIAVAAARLAEARGWPLAKSVRASLEDGGAQIAVVARLPMSPSAGVSRAALVLGLSGLEARVVAGLIEFGDARAAAQAAGVSYETARAALKDAMRKAGVRRQSAIVSVCMQIESGEAPEAALAPVLRDLFALTPRQAEVALEIARGATRAEAAQVLGLSESVIKSELKSVFASCLVDSGAALGRVVGQLAALTALAGAVAVDVHATGTEPLRLLPRHDGDGRIAFADYGPDTGAPTLFLHSGTTGRHLPAAYVEHLQRLGLRPIVVDRPGYGLTTMPEGDYLHAASDDLARIADHLALARINVVCRSGAIVVAHFARRHDERLGRAVLINPEPPAVHDSQLAGFLGGLKRLIFEQPAVLKALLRTLSRRAAPQSILRVARGAVRNSPADLTSLADPDFAAGFVHASQQAALQEGAGFIALERCVAEAALAPGDVPDDARFTILCGAEDSLQASEDALAWWRGALPNARFAVVENAGRFLHAQRPDLIAEALLS
ncbi:MAG: alpha/beta hydrolase [Hyphomonadaceae bacterium]